MTLMSAQAARRAAHDEGKRVRLPCWLWRDYVYWDKDECRFVIVQFGYNKAQTAEYRPAYAINRDIDGWEEWVDEEA